MNILKIKFTFLVLLFILMMNNVRAQDTVQAKKHNYFIAASGFYSASKNIDIARYYITRSIGGEVGFYLGKKNTISVTYERTQINEYDAKYKNLNFLNFSIKRLIPLGQKLQSTVAVSAGRASGKFINFGINSQGGSEIGGISKQAFLELGARYSPSNSVFMEVRFLQVGYVDKYIEKQFPSGLKAWVINDDEYFPLRLSVGYLF